MATFYRNSGDLLASVRAVPLALALLAGGSALPALAQQATLPVVVDNSQADPLLGNLQIAPNAAQAGMWSGVFQWPIIAIHASLLPDGRVLTFGAPPGGTVQDGRTLVFWDPRKGVGGNALQVLPNAQNVDSFCASATLLSDGRLLVSGGASGASGFSSREGMLTDWRTTSAVRDFNLNAPRWYGTMTKLPDGRAIVTGGGVPYANGDPNRPDATAPDISSTPEVYTPGQGWRSLVGAASTDAFGPFSTRWWYPRQWVSPAGTLFGISTEKVWELNPAGNGSIRTLRNFKTRADANTRPNVGPTNTAVMFDTGRILQVGGNGYFNGFASPSSAAATVFDITGLGAGRLTVTETQPMNNPRQWANSIVLPNGRVLVTGGSRFADEAGGNAVLTSEIWNPATGGWTNGAASSQYRGYHSTDLLLPNGAVLVAGGGAPGPQNNLNAEIYYPPYLFQQQGAGSVLAPRPRIVSLSTVTTNYNQQIAIQLATGDTVNEVSLIAAGSVTHSFDSNQRRLKPAFTRTATGLTVTMPASANLAPPGYYMLSVVNAAGVPSRSVIIAIAAAAPPAPGAAGAGGAVSPPSSSTAAPALKPDSSIRFEAVNVPGYLVRHVNYFANINPINAGSSLNDRLGAGFITRPGRGNPACSSFESTDQPGYFLQHENFRIVLRFGVDTTQSRNGTTWCGRPALNGSGNANDVSFESIDWPGYFMRHRNFELWMDLREGTPLYQADTTFRTASAGAVAGAQTSLQPVTWPDYRVRHANYLGFISAIGGQSDTVSKLDASFTVRRGLADPACVSFESKNFPGYFLQHRNFRMQIIQNVGGAGTRDATFCPRPAATGSNDIGTASFESLSWPGYFIAHRNFELFIIQRSAIAATDITFNVTPTP